MTWAWEELVKEEPTLGVLLSEAEAVKDDGQTPYFCSDEVWRRTFRHRFDRCVGFNAVNIYLCDPAAYEIALTKLLSALPPCRRCGCL